MNLNKDKLKKLREAASKATPGPWGPWSCNYPFYVDVEKPSQSLSKHDNERPTYWNIPDAMHVLEFNPAVAIQLLNRIDDLEEVLESHRKLVREIDVIISGEDGAAKQASLCDLVGPIKDLVSELKITKLGE